MNINLEEINSLWLMISGIVTGIGTFYAWINLKKYITKQNISESKKISKLSNVEGDEAIVKQIDFLLNQISLMSESMLKDKIAMSESNIKEIRYKEAISRIKQMCNICKINIETVLKDLNLN